MSTLVLFLYYNTYHCCFGGYFLPVELPSLIFAHLLFLLFRSGQARGALHYKSEGSNQNSQQREAVGVSPDEGTGMISL